MRKLKVTIDGETHIEEPNNIGIDFPEGVIDYHYGFYYGVNYTLLLNGKGHLFIRSGNTKHIPSKEFIKAVESKEFECSYINGFYIIK